jgi:jmjN domain
MSTDAMAVPAPEGEPVGLHSPPESNSAPKDLGSDSELSDLEPEPDTDELVGIKPEYISDGGVPVFRPSMEEFADFQRYVSWPSISPNFAPQSNAN